MKAALFCLTAWAFVAQAQPPTPADRKGCVESKVVSRMPGCFITRCDYKDFNVA